MPLDASSAAQPKLAEQIVALSDILRSHASGRAPVSPADAERHAVALQNLAVSVRHLEVFADEITAEAMEQDRLDRLTQARREQIRTGNVVELSRSSLRRRSTDR